MAEFVASQRPAVYALATAPPATARLAADLPVTLHDGTETRTPTARFLIAGPGDVTAMAPGQVIGRRPIPGSTDAEVTMMVHVELAAADLPWRFSPLPEPAPAGGLRPWLVLVAGTAAEVSRLPDGRVRLSGPALFAGHRLGQSVSWAHVHDVGGRRFARVLGPRQLQPGEDYVAALVPGWRATVAPDGSTTTLHDSWTDATDSVVLPCFDSWSFRTRDDPDDFASIAKRLEPLSSPEKLALAERGFGRAAVAVGPVPGDPLATAGALAAVPEDGQPLNEPLPAPVASAVQALTADRTENGRWVLSLPRYDVPWHPGPVEGEPWQWPPPGDEMPPEGWRRELRFDPRHRGAAGLGAWTAIAWQDRIAAGATRQVAAVAAAAQRIRHLTLGLRAARGLWVRRVPVEPVARLATLSPLLGRMPVDAGGGALDVLAGRTPALGRALFSSAARRMLRRRGPLARAASPGAASLGGLVAAANRCPDPQQPREADARILEVLADEGTTEQIASDMRQRAGDVLTAVMADRDAAAEAARSLEADGQVAVELLGGVRERTPETWCRPLSDLGAFASSIGAGVDPTVARPVVVDRVLGGIKGLRQPFLAEPDVGPEIDIPLWSFLSKHAPDWLLPGAGDIPVDRVLAVQTNPTFIDALLIGANMQTLGELRWRNIPITTRWTPLRRFWQQIDVGAGKVAPDIREVVALAGDEPLWTDASTLGDVTHLADPTHGTNLVVVLHTELFLRYPSTIVYATRNVGGAGTWGDAPNVDNPAEQPRVYPTFSGTLHPELVFFGFPLPPSAGTDHWIILEEPPPGYRFAHTAGASGDGAAFAVATFAPPVRVCLGNLL